MGYENHFMTFLRDGPNEGVALTILGSLRLLQQQHHPWQPACMGFHPNQEYSQTEGDNTMIDRAAATRDRERERVRRRYYARNVDVRYLRSLRCLRDRLRSSYSCNLHHCPAIKQRFDHHLELHSSTKCAYTPEKLPDGKDADDIRSISQCQNLMISEGLAHHQLKSLSKSISASLDEPEDCILDKSTMTETYVPIEHSQCKVYEGVVENKCPDERSTFNNGKALINGENNPNDATVKRLMKSQYTSIFKFQGTDSNNTDKAAFSSRTDKADGSKLDKCHCTKCVQKCREFEGRNRKFDGTDNNITANKALTNLNDYCSYKFDDSVSHTNNNLRTLTTNKIGEENAITVHRLYSSNTINPIKCVDKSINIELGDNTLAKKRWKCNKNLIHKEVREWLREVPIYPGLKKQEKENKDAAVKKLIDSLDILLSEVTHTDLKQKVKNEIDICLSKLPIWYPGTCTGLVSFKNHLGDWLLQNIKNICKRKAKKIKLNVRSNSPNRRICDTEVVDQSFALPSTQLENETILDMKDVKIAVIEWLWSIYPKLNSNNNAIKISDLADLVLIRLSSLLNKPAATNNYKLILETAIINVIDDLPINTNYDINVTSNIQTMAKDLADRLLIVQARFVNCNRETTPTTCSYSKQNTLNSSIQPSENIIHSELTQCFQDVDIDLNNMVFTEATNILHDFLKAPDFEKDRSVKIDLFNLFLTSTNLTGAQAIKITEVVIKRLKNVFSADKNMYANSETFNEFKKPSVISAYTSMEEMNGPFNFATSTPKKKPAQKTRPKLNLQETQYMEKVGNLIRAWMTTLPLKYDQPEEKNYKETMINDLAGDIVDEKKLSQLAPGARNDIRKYLRYYVCRWMSRLGTIDFTEHEPQIENFLDKLEEIPVPIMTQPQSGNRQAMDNLKFNLNASWHDNFLPKGADILEDEISIWMNEQPSDIFINNDPKFKQEKIQKLAQVLENKLKNKRPQLEISENVAQWLNNIIKSDKKPDIRELTENLKDRIVLLPQEATLADKLDREVKERVEHKKMVAERLKDKLNPLTTSLNVSKDNETYEQENTIKMLISKFIEHHNYDVDDPLARSAYNKLLKNYLQKLNSPGATKVANNIEKNIYDDKFNFEKLIRELEYVKDISDWLKTLPIDASYNSVGNKNRIDFVNNLAMNVREVEEEREKYPDAMDYDLYLGAIILEFLQLLPIAKEYLKNMGFMIEQLLSKINLHRLSVTNKLNQSTNTTGVNAENIGDFIEEFIRMNGDDVIANDEAKLEAWAIRLIREIKKLIIDTSYQSVLSKGQVFNKLGDVPIPGDDTVNLFNQELDYVKEITYWMKNLPLLPTNQSEEDNLTAKVCQLAEKITEMEREKSSRPNDAQINTDFKEYVENWILELPLDKRQEIIVPVLMKQLMKRIHRVQQQESPEATFSLHNKCSCSVDKNNSSSTKVSHFKNGLQGSSSNLIIDVIEKWVNELPINESIVHETNLKNNICRQLFQKVCELNVDPEVYNDDILYKNMLTNEIDLIFENLPEATVLHYNRESLKTDIVDAIVEVKNILKEKTAGDTYKHKLEQTIEASIPHPVSFNQVYDPGFEIYKDRLARMFIIDNYDHGTDLVKMKYEQLLKKEIDKYFDHAKNKNAAPISKDQLYLELYGTLFKVPIPNEASIVSEVEEIKTRCEIDAWFEELPIREPSGLNEQFEWEQILSTLAKRIHETETKLPQSDQKMFKEIIKCIVKLPIQSRNEQELELYATNLLERLKTTSDQRKCILTETFKKRKGKETVNAGLNENFSKHKEISGSNSSGNTWTTLTQEQQTLPRKPNKKTADVIVEIVQSWCSLVINTNTTSTHEPDTQMLKDKLTTKIIIKISELNTDPDIFNNSILYEELLDEELEILLATLPTTHDFHKSKAARKNQLIDAIKSTKHLLIGEKAKHLHKQELNKTVDKILEKPKNMTADEEILFVEVRNDIVDNFIQLKYNEVDDEDTQSHKLNIQNDISKLFRHVSHLNEPEQNVLMKRNQVICELENVCAKREMNLTDEIEEIQLKKEIGDFFNELKLPNKSVDKAKLNYFKASLAKKLTDVEINGNSNENDSKIKKEITRCLSKLHVDAKNADIDSFINKMKSNEKMRRARRTSRKVEKSVVVCQENCWNPQSQTGRQSMQRNYIYTTPDGRVTSTNINRSIAVNSDDHHALNYRNNERLGSSPRVQNPRSDLENIYEENERYDKPDKYYCRRKLKSCSRRPICMFPKDNHQYCGAHRCC